MAASDNRPPWFPCQATPLLGALQAMKPHIGYTYWIVCLRIYETGGPCRDTIEALARRTGYSKRVVSNALDVLFRQEKLKRDGDGMMNDYCREVLAEIEARRDSASRVGSLRANRRWEKSKKNQRNGNASCIASAMHSDAQLQLQVTEEERTPPIGGVVGERKTKAGTPLVRVPDGFALTVADLEYASEHGFDRRAAQRLFESFMDHHRSRANKRAGDLGWRLSWKEWVRNEVKFAQRRNGNGSYPARRTFADIARGG